MVRRPPLLSGAELFQHSLTLEELGDEIETKKAGLIAECWGGGFIVSSRIHRPSCAPTLMGDRFEMLQELESLLRQQWVLNSRRVRCDLYSLHKLLLHALPGNALSRSP